MHRALGVALMLVAGCNRTADDGCLRVARHMDGLLETAARADDVPDNQTDTLRRTIGDRMAQRCQIERWDKEARTCVLASKTLNDVIAHKCDPVARSAKPRS